jgi:WXG100 family type VII secretion target
VSEAYANELETWFASFPAILHDPLRPIFDKMNEGLRWVAGDPQQLVGVAAAYVDAGARLHALVQEQAADRQALAGQWTGPSFDAFTAKMADIEAKIGTLGDATAQTKEILDAAAQAAVDGANMIIDLIVTLLTLLLAELAINAALIVLTWGASALAFIAEAIASGIATLSEIFSVVAEVAEVLVQLSQLFGKLGELLRVLARFFEALKDMLAALKGLKEGASGLGKAGWFSAHAAGKWAAGKVIDGATGGWVPIPGVAGGAWDTGGDYHDAWGDADKAVDAANE